jgi:hypothetical protein
MESISSKQKIKGFIDSLPDNLTADEIIYRLYLEQKLLKSEQQIHEGKTHSHEEVKEIVKKWLN